MPAIHLPRLRRQAADLAEYFPRPSLFIRHLRDLFEYYGDRTRRPSRVGPPPIIIQAYQVPEPVLRQVMVELLPLAEAHPKAALNLAEALWEQPRFEFRLLAARLLGMIPPKHSDAQFDLIEKWIQGNRENLLLEALGLEGLQSLRRQRPEDLLARIHAWLGAESRPMQQLGWRALLHLLTDTGYENLPVIFDYIGPHVPDCPKSLRPYIRDAFVPIADRSPQEAAFFLRRLLSEHGKTNTLTWLTRQMLNRFPTDLRQSLRAEVGLRKSR